MVKPKFVHGAPLVNSPSPRLDLGGRSNGSGTGSAEGNGRDVDGFKCFGAIHLRERMGSGSSGVADASVDGDDGDGEDTRSWFGVNQRQWTAHALARCPAQRKPAHCLAQVGVVRRQV